MTVKEFYELAVKNGAENNCIFYDDPETCIWEVTESEIFFDENGVIINYD